jgi:hypothetical protein
MRTASAAAALRMPSAADSLGVSSDELTASDEDGWAGAEPMPGGAGAWKRGWCAGDFSTLVGSPPDRQRALSDFASAASALRYAVEGRDPQSPEPSGPRSAGAVAARVEAALQLMQRFTRAAQRTCRIESPRPGNVLPRHPAGSQQPDDSAAYRLGPALSATLGALPWQPPPTRPPHHDGATPAGLLRRALWVGAPSTTPLVLSSRPPSASPVPRLVLSHRPDPASAVAIHRKTAGQAAVGQPQHATPRVSIGVPAISPGSMAAAAAAAAPVLRQGADLPSYPSVPPLLLSARFDTGPFVGWGVTPRVSLSSGRSNSAAAGFQTPSRAGGGAPGPPPMSCSKLEVRSQLAATDRTRLDRVRGRAADVLAAWRARRARRAALAAWALAAAWAASAAERPIAAADTAPPSPDFETPRVSIGGGAALHRPVDVEATYAAAASQGAGAARRTPRRSPKTDASGGVALAARPPPGLLPPGLLPGPYVRALVKQRLNRLSHDFLRGWCRPAYPTTSALPSSPLLPLQRLPPSPLPRPTSLLITHPHAMNRCRKSLRHR